MNKALILNYYRIHDCYNEKLKKDGSIFIILFLQIAVV